MDIATRRTQCNHHGQSCTACSGWEGRETPNFSPLSFSPLWYSTLQYSMWSYILHDTLPHLILIFSTFCPIRPSLLGEQCEHPQLQAKLPWVIELMPNITPAANHLCNVHNCTMHMHCGKLGKKFCNENTKIYVWAELPWLKNRWFKYVLHGIGSFSAAPGWKISESSKRDSVTRFFASCFFHESVSPPTPEYSI